MNELDLIKLNIYEAYDNGEITYGEKEYLLEQLDEVNELTDHGKEMYIVNIDKVTKANSNYRTALWTGNYLQTTLMSIPVGSDIGLEMHEDFDQFIRVEDGNALVMMGDEKEHLDYKQYVSDDFAIFIPANTWHNIINVGDVPLKLYSIYAPSHHPFGTIQRTKSDAEDEE